MSKNPLKLYASYQEAKDELIEQTVSKVELISNPLFFVLALSLTSLCWLFAITSIRGFEQLYNETEFYFIFFLFVTSYFSIYLGSKIVFKPNQQEFKDDTSILAIFSACGRKANRSLVSIGLSLLHCLIFIIYLINKDLGFLSVFQ